MAYGQIPAPRLRAIFGPLLPALPVAAVSSQPAPAIVRLLSPILRQRVKVFSADDKPWLRLMCYDDRKIPQLFKIASSETLEPHPLSGEVEIDWDYDVEIQYRRVDVETLQTKVLFKSLRLIFLLEYCTHDVEVGSSGWRIAEVTVADDESSPFAGWNGSSSLAEAENEFATAEAERKVRDVKSPETSTHPIHATDCKEWQRAVPKVQVEDEDDLYWARYDATPARTPSAPQPPPYKNEPKHELEDENGDCDSTMKAAEKLYFMRHDRMHPVMERHSSDEATAGEHTDPFEAKPVLDFHFGTTQFVSPSKPLHEDSPPVLPPLGLAFPTSYQLPEGTEDTGGDSDTVLAADMSPVWRLVEKTPRSSGSSNNEDRIVDLVHPRPMTSSASSTGSQMVAKLQERAEEKQSSDLVIKQHVSRSIRSLFELSRAAGMDREEFDRLVSTELDSFCEESN